MINDKNKSITQQCILKHLTPRALVPTVGRTLYSSYLTVKTGGFKL